jgi:hypothetical protein
MILTIETLRALPTASKVEVKTIPAALATPANKRMLRTWPASAYLAPSKKTTSSFANKTGVNARAQIRSSKKTGDLTALSVFLFKPEFEK